MATTMSDELLERLARRGAERDEAELAEEACELMLLRTSRLGWPQAGHVVAHGGLRFTGPKGGPATLVWARFEFAAPLADNDGLAMCGFVVAYCPEAFCFHGLPVFCGKPENAVDHAVREVTGYVGYIARYGRCSDCGTYDVPQLESVGSTGDEAFAVYTYVCPRCGHRMVNVLD